jgi:hypothetical protein
MLLLSTYCIRNLLLDPSQGRSLASKGILNQRLPEMERFSVCLPSLIQFPFGYELIHFCTLSLLGIVPYKLLTISGELRVFLIVLGLQPYIHKVCDSYFLYYCFFNQVLFFSLNSIPISLIAIFWIISLPKTNWKGLICSIIW